jgi:hemoglobin
MKKDIETRKDIELLVRRFYDKVIADPLIGPVFTDLAKVDWDKHLPVMFDFWENTLFYTGGYTGNPMKSHQDLHRKWPLQASWFKQWLTLFIATVDELYEGEKAVLAKQRATSISTVMQIKILEAGNAHNGAG